MPVQSIHFKKALWTVKGAKKWLRDNQIKPMKKEHLTENEIRFRIINPDPNCEYVSKEIEKGIIFIYMMR